MSTQSANNELYSGQAYRKKKVFENKMSLKNLLLGLYPLKNQHLKICDHERYY